MIIRKITLIPLLLLLFSGYIYGQTLFGELDAKSINTKELVCNVVNDSILVSYSKGETIQHFWLTSSGKITRDFIYGLPSMFYTTDNKTVAYTFDQKASDLRVSLSSNGKWTGLGALKVVGSLLGSFVDKNLFLVTFDNKSNTLGIFELNENQIIRETKFEITTDLSKELKDERKVEFYKSFSSVESFKRASDVKIIKQEGPVLQIVINGPNFSGRTSPSNLHILTLNYATGAQEVKRISIDERGMFSSFVFGQNLYLYVVSNKEMLLKVIDLSTEKIIQEVRTTKGSEGKIFGRTTLDYSVSKDYNFDVLMRISGKPSLQILQENNQTFIKAGVDVTHTKMVGPAGAGSLVAGIVAMAVGTTLRQMIEDPDGSSYHFYYTEQSTGDYAVNLNTDFIRDRLDAYESTLVKDKKVNYKAYLPYKKGVMAIYNHPKMNKIRFVVFE